jgi:hypothetical protein
MIPNGGFVIKHRKFSQINGKATDCGLDHYDTGQAFEIKGAKGANFRLALRVHTTSEADSLQSEFVKESGNAEFDEVLLRWAVRRIAEVFKTVSSVQNKNAWNCMKMTSTSC